ncbi:MAG: hypothetical protein J5998_08505 [Clostridia bacterium]|nr:hypothetical protein [Clostridia bacterium]
MKKDAKRDALPKDSPPRGGMRPLKRLLKNRSGQVRLMIVLLAALAVYALCVPAAEWLYWTGFNALLKLWGITDRNIARAPWPVRQFARFSGVVLTLVQGALLFALSRAMTRFLPGRMASWRGRACAGGAAGGAVSLLLLWGVLVLADNMRLGWPLSRPAWSIDAALLSLTAAVTAAAGLCWGLTLFSFLERSLPEAFAVALGTLLLAPVTLSSAHIDAPAVVNTLLCGMVCCLSLKRKGSWAWAAGFLSALWIMERAVLGFPGFDAALFETYPVNYYWVNGGEKGLWNGAAMTVLLLGWAALFIRPIRRRAAS